LAGADLVIPLCGERRIADRRHEPREVRRIHLPTVARTKARAGTLADDLVKVKRINDKWDL
jgi:hypothetical protein